MKRSFILTALSFLILAQITWAQVPQTISYQGVLRDPGTKEIVPDDDYYVTFSIYDVFTATTPVWTSNLIAVPVADGVFSVVLGGPAPTSPLPDPFPSQAWLGIKVEPDTEEMPRIELTSVPYSLKAAIADTAKSVSGASNVFPGDGNVGIGTTTPTASLDVVDFIKVSNSFGNRLFEAKEESTNLGIMQVAFGNVIKAKISSNGDSYFNGGSVGIGTTTPEGLLHIKRSGGSQLMLGNDNQPNLEWYFDVDAVAKMTLQNEKSGSPMTVMAFDNNDGNVGIGTPTPTAKLHIGGTAGVDGIRFPDNTLQTTASTSLWSPSGSDIYYDAGNVGIGTASPLAAAGVHIERGDESPTTYGLYVRNTNKVTAGYGVVSNVNFAGGETHTAFQASAAGATNNWAFYGNNGNGYFADSLGIGTESLANRLSVSGGADFSGDVGIGTATQTAKLEVAGTVKADTLQLATPAERWYAIPGPEFRAYIGSATTEPTNLYLYSSGTWNYNWVSAGVHLPHGAMITDFQARVLDNSIEFQDSTSFAIDLWKLTAGSATTSLSSITTSSSSSAIQIKPGSFVDHQVDNQYNTYLVTARWRAPWTNQNLKLYDVSIKYTVDQPLP